MVSLDVWCTTLEWPVWVGNRAILVQWGDRTVRDPCLVLYSPAVPLSYCTWMLGLHQDCTRIVDCSLRWVCVCCRWVVMSKLELHGDRKSILFECSALAEL